MAASPTAGSKTDGENASTKYYANDAAQAIVTSKLDKRHCSLRKFLRIQCSASCFDYWAKLMYVFFSATKFVTTTIKSRCHLKFERGLTWVYLCDATSLERSNVPRLKLTIAPRHTNVENEDLQSHLPIFEWAKHQVSPWRSQSCGVFTQVRPINSMSSLP